MFPTRLKTALGCALAVALGLIAWRSLDALGSQARAAEPPPKRSEKLQELLKARIKAGQNVYDARLQGFKEGRISMDQVLEAERLRVAAELDFRDKKEDRVAVCEDHVTNSKSIKELSDAKLQAGKIGNAEMALAEYNLLDAQILLEREKAK